MDLGSLIPTGDAIFWLALAVAVLALRATVIGCLLRHFSIPGVGANMATVCTLALTLYPIVARQTNASVIFGLAVVAICGVTWDSFAIVNKAREERAQITDLKNQISGLYEKIDHGQSTNLAALNTRAGELSDRYQELVTRIERFKGLHPNDDGDGPSGELWKLRGDTMYDEWIGRLLAPTKRVIREYRAFGIEDPDLPKYLERDAEGVHPHLPIEDRLYEIGVRLHNLQIALDWRDNQRHLII